MAIKINNTDVIDNSRNVTNVGFITATQSLTLNTVTFPGTGNPVTVSGVQYGYYAVQMTQQNASGTSVDFTGIPSWVKRITIMLDGVSTSGTSGIRFRLGSSLAFAISGYFGTTSFSSASISPPANGQTFSAGFDTFGDNSSSVIRTGMLVICNMSGNTWALSGLISGDVSAFNMHMMGTVTLLNTLTRVRITTVNGTDTLDAGTINVMYE